MILAKPILKILNGLLKRENRCIDIGWIGKSLKLLRKKIFQELQNNGLVVQLVMMNDWSKGI